MHSTTYQFLKFAIVGVLNTIIDFSVLNVLISFFGLQQGDSRYALYKSISFIVAVLNSFLFNKLWVFRKTGIYTSDTKKELSTFFGVSIIGLVINTLVSTLAFAIGQYVYPHASTHVWANAGALTGTVVVLISNFFGYKLLVFKR